MGITSIIKACTFKLTNNAGVRVWITSANVGKHVSAQQLEDSQNVQRLRINIGNTKNFGPKIKHFFVYVNTQGSQYTLARELKTTRCGSAAENKFTIRDIFNPAGLKQKQPGRFIITVHSNITPNWIYYNPKAKFDI